MIYDEYAQYTEQFKKSYGENVVVLMEVGSFWELYDCDEHRGADMKAICDLLNIQISKKNKAINTVSSTNPLMAGFPSYTLKKFLPVLLDNCFTVVLVSQVTPPPNPKRAVTNIYSKGTYVPDDDATTTDRRNICKAARYLMSIVLHADNIVSAAAMDLAVGDCHVFESTLDQLETFMNVCPPSEILFVTRSSSSDHDAALNSLKHEWKRERVYVHHQNISQHEFSANISYQNQFLTRIYPVTGLLSPLEYLDLERRPLSAMALVILFQFAYEHDENVLTRIGKPILHDTMEFGTADVVLSPNALKQLDVPGLATLYNRCKTAPGRRAFQQNIASPHTRISDLEDSYRAIEALSETPDNVNHIRQYLDKVYDLEHLFRRILLKRLQPCQLSLLQQSLEALASAIDIFEKIINTHSQLPFHLHALITFMKERVDFERANTQRMEDLQSSFFQPGKYKDLDECEAQGCAMESQLTNMVLRLQALYPSACFKLETNDRDGTFLICTAKRYKEIAASLSALEDIELSGLTLMPSSASNYVRVCSPKLRLMHMENASIQSRMRSVLRDCYVNQFIPELTQCYGDYFNEISMMLKRIDVITTNAANASEFALCRPRISANASKSFVELNQVRHPIIERVMDDIPYVANDVYLGKDVQDNNKANIEDGLLLYGLNAAGKSSLMKAVGLNIILAQSGMFVAAKHMNYKPYTKMFTRITHQDDLYRGQSTFMIEMSELRQILKHADCNSIVLGDELCSGTESISATAIVASGVHRLATRHVSFIFTSHLHDIPELPIIQSLENVGICHLRVNYDSSTGKLVFDRVLQPGSGSTLYGLEVCKALDMDNEFMMLAHNIRREMLEVPDSLIKKKKSSYNSKLYVDAHCAICKSTDNIQVHHINERHTANANGYIGHEHKNKKSNLVCLCETCHFKIHNGCLMVEGYKQTSEGVELKVNTSPAASTETSVELIEDVRMMRDKKMSWQKIKDILKQSHGLNLSLSKIKMLSDRI